MICSMTGRLPTARLLRESACWARGGRRARMSCVIFWRAIMFLINGLTSSFPPTIRKPNACSKLWGRRRASLPVVLFPDGTKLLEAAPADVAQKVGLRTRRANQLLRSGHCRRRPGGPGRGRLWRVGRPAYRDDRARSARRPGRHEFAHRELSGISRPGSAAAIWRGARWCRRSALAWKSCRRRKRSAFARKDRTASSSWRMAMKFPATR